MKALEFQRAVHAALAADAGLMALVAGIYDHRPLKAAPPVIVIGASAVADWSAKGLAGERHSLTLHVWSRGPGQSEAKALLARMKETLASAAFDIPGAKTVFTRMPFAEAMEEPETKLVHGVLRLESVLIEQ